MQSNEAFFSISAGPSWARNGATQRIEMQPLLINQYIAKKPFQTLANGSVVAGHGWPLNDILHGRLGLSLATNSAAALEGTVWETGEPQFDNFTYHYHLQHTHLIVQGQLLATSQRPLIPYLQGGVGLGLNRSYYFVTTPKLFEAVEPPPFGNHTQVAFCYTAGVGLLHNLTPHWQSGVGYELASWGASHLAAAAGQTTGHGLSLNGFYNQQLLFTLTYLS